MRFLLFLACGLALLGLLCTAAAVPAWRHRHVGDTAHTHTATPGQSHTHHAHTHHAHTHTHHGHSHSHQHGGDSATAIPAREGWHLHLSLFGWEMTLWEPGFLAASESTVQETAPPARTASGSEVRLTGPPAVSWVSLFLIDAGPLPRCVTLPPRNRSLAAHALRVPLCGRAADAPPVPVPKAI